MDAGRRERVWNDIELLSCVRKRIKGIRDDEDRALRGSAAHGYGSQEASDLLSEADHALLIVIDRLERARRK